MFKEMDLYQKPKKNSMPKKTKKLSVFLNKKSKSR